MSKFYFTSDQHFRHNNILKFENRPYSSIEEMEEELINSWNSTVSKNDIVYHLGDFVFGGITKWREVLPKLNGRIILIKGNHDNDKVVRKALSEGLIDELHMVGHYFKHEKNEFWLTHYPMEIGLRPNKWSIHGHIHSTPSRHVNQINVGVDSGVVNRAFGSPISLSEIMYIVEHRREQVLKEFKLERGES